MPGCGRGGQTGCCRVAVTTPFYLVVGVQVSQEVTADEAFRLQGQGCRTKVKVMPMKTSKGVFSATAKLSEI